MYQTLSCGINIQKQSQEPEPRVTTLQSIYREVMTLITQNVQEKETATAFGCENNG